MRAVHINSQLPEAQQISTDHDAALALFPQYKALQELAGALRVHPADLRPLDWVWHEPAASAAAMPAVALDYVPPVRARMDPAVLRIVKGRYDTYQIDVIHSFVKEAV